MQKYCIREHFYSWKMAKKTLEDDYKKSLKW